MLNKAAFLATVLMFLTAYGFGVFAGEPSQGPQDQPATSEAAVMPTFDQLDLNDDDKISPVEAEDSWLSEAFATVDLDHDGFVNRSEYEEAIS